MSVHPLPDSLRRARLGWRSVTSKLLGCLLVLTAISVAALTIMHHSHNTVRSSMRELTQVATPLDRAAHEMEINTLGSAVAITQYVRTGDRAQRARLADDEGDFRRASADWQRLAVTRDERALGARVRAAHARFVELGRAMMARSDHRAERLTVAYTAFTALQGDLERAYESEPAGADPAATRVTRLERTAHADLGEIVGQVGAYLARGRDDRREVRREAREFRARLGALRASIRRSRDPVAIERTATRLATANSALQQALVDHRRLAGDTARFTALRESIDGMLDEGVQVLSRRRFAAAEQRADRSFADAQRSWLTLGGLFIVMTLVALVLLRRAIARPIARLTEGTAAVAAGDLDHRIDASGSDEFGLLGRHFNHMVSQLRQTLVSKEALEHSEADLRAMTTRLAEQASTDSLTDLANRRRFEQRLAEAAAVGDGGRGNVLCYLDLDQFKIVNDTCGHAAGDELLRRVASVLLARLRPNDTVARLGGDEFGLILMDCSMVDGERVAEELRRDLHRLRFDWEGLDFTVTASIGVVPIAGPEGDLQAAMKAADAACYAAKERGRNRVQVYVPGDHELLARQSEMESIPRLTSALDAGRFELDAQPIVALDPANRAPAHYELLVRLRDEAGQRIPPGAFIPAAERYGLMPQVDRWVIGTAFAELARRLENRVGAGIDEVWAINLSGTSIAAAETLSYVLEQFDAHAIPPGAICFEITETAVMTDLTRAVAFIERLREIGCRFALDDFGRGMSSFAYLKNLHVDYVKIDGTFVRDLTDGPVAAALVRSINDVGHAVGALTIAEMVEDDATLEILREIGVDFVQGFLLAKPSPLGETLSRGVEPPGATRMPRLVPGP